VRLQVRHIDRFVERHREGMAAGAHQLDHALSRSGRLQAEQTDARATKSNAASRPWGDGLTFLTAPGHRRHRDHRAVIAQALRVVIDQRRPTSFVVLRVFSRRTSTRSYSRARSIRNTPIGQGWLRASHRKRDQKIVKALPAVTTPTTRSSRSRKARWWSSMSRSGRPSIVVPKGYRIGLSIRGKDYVLCGPERRQAVELQERADRLRAVSCTTIRTTGRRRSLVASTTLHFWPAGAVARCCCRSFWRSPPASPKKTGQAMTQWNTYGPTAGAPARQARARGAAEEYDHRHPRARGGAGGGRVREAAPRSGEKTRW